MSGETVSGIVLGIGAPNRASDGRAVQCGIVLSDGLGLCRIYADYGGVMSKVSVWDQVQCGVHVHNGDSRVESWKLDDALVLGRIESSAEKREILESCVLPCGNEDPIDLMNRERRSIGLIRLPSTGVGYSMSARDFNASPDWVQAQKETPQRASLLWTSDAGKNHEHQLCAHECFEYWRRNPSSTSKVWQNLHIEDIDYEKWILVGNTKDRRNVWVVVHLHRLKKTIQQLTIANCGISDGRPKGWPYLLTEEIRARRVASTGQQQLFTT